MLFPVLPQTHHFLGVPFTQEMSLYEYIDTPRGKGKPLFRFNVKT